MIQTEVVTSHPVMHALNSPRISGDLLSVIPKPAKLFSEMKFGVFRQKMPIFCWVSMTVTSIEIEIKAEFFLCGFNLRGWNLINMPKNPSKRHATNGLLAEQNVQSLSSLSITALRLAALLCSLNDFYWAIEDFNLAPWNTADVCTYKKRSAVRIWCTCLGDSEGICCRWLLHRFNCHRLASRCFF